ncbi:UNVERIFIED_CONTAM: putative receptor-like protein kinase [Sesamum calycinum]|uniref:Receptor-like protein kinase n=1 Tax=Sesamum calycinum TaxID=2727403 RepID=A0AAW2NF98_9LAMI
MKMILFLLLIPIWVFSFPSFSAPLDVKPDPPVSDPVLPTEKDPFFKDSSDFIAHSPVFFRANLSPLLMGSEVAEVKVVHHQDLNKKILVALVVSASLLGGILLLLLCFSIYRLKKLKKSNAKSDQNSDAAKGMSFGPILDKFNSLKIGGKKASIAAIEYPFSCCSLVALELQNEVESLSKIQHQNIVSLLGYCIHGEARFLVYEMMENGSLEFHLHGPSPRSTLTWHLRMKIALDVARGLEYLHERCNPPVIHRDLKSSNILLDSNFNAKLSDFGLAITGGNSNKTNVKLSGTLGYVAPEYLLDGKLTDKSDVYAFGVVLLELLTGRRPVERVAEAQCESITTWAMPQLTDRSKLPSIVDPAIRNTMDLKHLYQVAAIAVLCVQPEPSYRPLITDVLHSFIPLCLSISEAH